MSRLPAALLIGGPVTAVLGSAGQALVTRIGARPVAAGGLALVGAGSGLLAGVPVDGGGFVRDLLPGLLVFGPGLGACAVAGSIAALTGVAERESGVASGINTAAFQIGAFGVAVVSSVAVSATHGSGRLAAMTAGYQAAFTACVVLTAAGLACATVLLRRPRRPARSETETGTGTGTDPTVTERRVRS
ncbi:hypothetical protein ACIRU3_40150 [Streptomyces sp. NPDC101151]|uniref:hypothetical protein n=1 Tax=Streptomyces sp. NPDC101151 TaxID=3366115 RepID=UPI0037F7A9AD